MPWHDMTGAEKMSLVARLIGEAGSFLFWLGVVLLVCLPLLIASFR